MTSTWRSQSARHKAPPYTRLHPRSRAGDIDPALDGRKVKVVLKEEQERWEIVLQATSGKPESTTRHSSVGVQTLSTANEASLHHQSHWSLHLLFLLTRTAICPACSPPFTWPTFTHPSGLNGDVISSQEACSDPGPIPTELGALLTATSSAPLSVLASLLVGLQQTEPHKGRGGVPPGHLPLYPQCGAKFQPFSGSCQWTASSHLPQEDSPDCPRRCQASPLLSHSPLSRCFGMPG